MVFIVSGKHNMIADQTSLSTSADPSLYPGAARSSVAMQET
jgi:hypothetical protein